ncbi:MAG TPA: GntR family transcriptional regulator [Anaerolineae bacterium]
MGSNSHPVSLSQQAYERIRHQIISLELPPGEVIDEATLQKELGLGRTPIREALKRLALEKLVMIVPRRGMFVTDIGITDLQWLFEMRLTLEALAARLAAQRGKQKHWDRMTAVLAALPAEDDSVDNETLIAIDEACHHIMYEAAENEFLRDTLTTLYALSLRLWYFSLSKIGDMRRAVLEHRAILEALLNRDGDKAAQLLRQHIQAFQEEIQSGMMGVPAFDGEVE